MMKGLCPGARGVGTDSLPFVKPRSTVLDLRGRPRPDADTRRRACRKEKVDKGRGKNDVSFNLGRASTRWFYPFLRQFDYRRSDSGRLDRNRIALQGQGAPQVCVSLVGLCEGSWNHLRWLLTCKRTSKPGSAAGGGWWVDCQ